MAHYDALFRIGNEEAIDTNIVLVEWDEQSIRALKESTISDRTLLESLDKIFIQNPRLVGLDLYRDLPVANFDYDVADNKKANRLLEEIFAQNTKIIGIQKIIPPKVRPSAVLQQEQRAAAADLPADSDFRVRRAYMFPSADMGTGANVPYIGVVLGYKFLESEGWQADNIFSGISFFHQDARVELKELSDHKYLFDPQGLDFLISWRNVKSRNNFERVSVIDLLDGNVPLETFKDRLVIIGNVTSYSGDIHRTSIARWNIISWTTGLEIVAHVASSIISAVKQERNMISVVPQIVEMLVSIASIIGLVRVARYYYLKRNTLVGMRLATFAYTSGLILSLLIFSVALFNSSRMWFDIVPICLATAMSWIFLLIYIPLKKEKRDFNYLRLLIKDFKHSIGSVSARVGSSNRNIVRYSNHIKEELKNESLASGMDEIDFASSSLAKQFNAIELRAANIKRELARIKVYQERTSGFLRYTYTKKDFDRLEYIDINQTILPTAKTCIERQDSRARLIYNLDRSIGKIKIHSEDLAIITENLVFNAMEAVNVEESDPWIEIATKNYPRFIEITVADNGIGMTEAQQKIVFQPFKSFRKNGQGIGLFLVQQIVQQRAGSIKLESQLGKGSSFKLKIPK